jgi:hypothetical protein
MSNLKPSYFLGVHGDALQVLHNIHVAGRRKDVCTSRPQTSLPRNLCLSLVDVSDFFQTLSPSIEHPAFISESSFLSSELFVSFDYRPPLLSVCLLLPAYCRFEV